MTPTFDDNEKTAVNDAKHDFSHAADRLVDTVKRQASDAISGLASQIVTSSHETSTAFSADVGRVSDAVASGLRTVKAELTVPKVVKEHPLAWVAGGLAVGAAGLILVKSFTRPPVRPVARATVGSSLGGKLALTALDIGLSLWLARRSRQGDARGVRPSDSQALALH